jgi:hypothetical protein
VYSSSRNRVVRSGNGLSTHNNITRPGQTQTATTNFPASSPRQTQTIVGITSLPRRQTKIFLPCGSRQRLELSSKPLVFVQIHS